MAQQLNVAVIIGSLRKGSLTRKVANALIRLAPPSLACSIAEIGDLPLYNQDLEDSVPEPWARFRAAIRASDAMLFVTPEYNRSIPGGLKNAIDVGSRPYGKNSFAGKSAGVVSVTPGALGGMAANIALRSALVFVDVPTMQQPEAYIAKAGEIFDDADEIKAKETRDFFTDFMRAYADWVQIIVAARKK
jgi:chromate reductase, NAD(P)H dehydrogenase (quinone)